MRIFTNEDLIKKQAKAARSAATIGITLMLVAVVLSFNPRYVSLAYAALFISLPLVSWGVNRGEKWLRDPRPDQIVAKALKGLSHAYRLYSFLLPVEQVLLCPAGLFVLHLKMVDGKISCRGEKWHRHFKWSQILRVFSEERLGNPSKRARDEAKKLHRFVTARLPDVDIAVRPVIVFVNPSVELDVVEPSVPAVLLRDLKAYLRDASEALSKEKYKALTDLFNERST